MKKGHDKGLNTFTRNVENTVRACIEGNFYEMIGATAKKQLTTYGKGILLDCRLPPVGHNRARGGPLLHRKAVGQTGVTYGVTRLFFSNSLDTSRNPEIRRVLASLSLVSQILGSVILT